MERANLLCFLGNNGGVGGSCQVGCLLYTFEGGRGDPPSDPCKDFNCSQCGTPFDPPTCQQCCENLFSTLLTVGNASTNTGSTIVDNIGLNNSSLSLK